MKELTLFVKNVTRPARMAWNKFYREKWIFPRLSKDTIRAVIRHEAHRIEKAYYNNVFHSKKKIYMEKADNILFLLEELKKKTGASIGRDLDWAKEIALHADRLDRGFIDYDRPKQGKEAFFTSDSHRVDFVKEVFTSRRSVRVWSDDQPDEHERLSLANRFIECAVNMPSSGNRQTVRFVIFNSIAQKDLLKGLKEKHCYDAPLVIGVFSDQSLYGSYGTFSNIEECLFIDAAAAASAVLIAAEIEGYSTCWNHFGSDLIASRKINRERFKKIQKHYALPPCIRPVALIAIGKEQFQPPAPTRMPVEEYIYND